MTVRCALRPSLGAFLLGGLPPAAHREFAAHLSACGTCPVEMEELVPVAALLARGGDADLHTIPAVPDTLRSRVLSATRQEGMQAVLQQVRDTQTGSGSTASPALSSVAGGVGKVAATSATTPDEETSSGEGQRGDALAARRALDRRRRLPILVAAALIAAVLGAVAIGRSTQPAGESIELVALKGEPIRARVTVRELKNGRGTVADIVVENTDPNEIYFAWFEDPKGERIGLGSFRGAQGEVRFRGQTGFTRDGIAAVGASTRRGEERTDRLRAELKQKRP